MNFYAFPWSCYYESYDTDGWFLPGTQEIVFLHLDHFSEQSVSPGGPAILTLVSTDIECV